MPGRRPRFLVAGAWCLATALASLPLTANPSPPAPAGELASGPYSSMHMMVQKTILKINVATIEVRFDKTSQTRFGELARGQAYSDAIAPRLAQVAIGAARAEVQMQFKHDVSLDRWMGVVRTNLEQARAAALIPRDLAQRVSQNLPVWFAPLRDRGYQKGDQLIYMISPSAIRTRVVSAGGQALVDLRESDEGTRRVVLASYFAPGSELREPLLRSLFESPR
jgi:hypothetical protein